MLNVSKEQWLEWRDHPVTRVLNKSVDVRIDEAKEQIVGSTDPEFDRFAKGMSWAFREVLEFEPDLLQEESKVEIQTE